LEEILATVRRSLAEDEATGGAAAASGTDREPRASIQHVDVPEQQPALAPAMPGDLPTSIRTLEDFVGEGLRPLLQAWLDENLPAMVHRLIQAEIDRAVREAGKAVGSPTP
jgi:cell pole-organizing protein PopZ